MADSCCSGTVDIRAMESRQRRVLMIVLATNIATFVMMLAAAIYTGSSSLLSGSLDNLGDALTYRLSIALIGASTRAKAKVALLNLAFNGICLWLVTPYRRGDVNMGSAWECSRNDVVEGMAVSLAALGVWLFDVTLAPVLAGDVLQAA